MNVGMRILVIDDHPLFREGLKSLLTGLAPEVEVVQACSVDDARRFAVPEAQLRPDLVLMDWFMPGVQGVAALHQVRGLFEDAAVVVVSGEESPQVIREAIQQGASGYIPKSTDPSVTTQALRLVLAQGVYLPREALTGGDANTVAPSGARQGGTDPSWAEQLSPRQFSVLKCLLQGKPNKVIAREIGIAEGTVKAHLWAVYQLLGASNRAQAMYRAHELGLFGHLPG